MTSTGNQTRVARMVGGTVGYPLCYSYHRKTILYWNGTRTHDLGHKRTLNHLAKLTQKIVDTFGKKFENLDLYFFSFTFSFSGKSIIAKFPMTYSLNLSISETDLKSYYKVRKQFAINIKLYANESISRDKISCYYIPKQFVNYWKLQSPLVSRKSVFKQLDHRGKPFHLAYNLRILFRPYF